MAILIAFEPNEKSGESRRYNRRAKVRERSDRFGQKVKASHRIEPFPKNRINLVSPTISESKSLSSHRLRNQPCKWVDHIRSTRGVRGPKQMLYCVYRL